MMEQDNFRWEVLLPWIPVTVFLCCWWGGIKVGNIDAGQATIIGALIGGAVAVILDLFESFRNGKAIGKIEETTSGEIKPKVNNINYLAERQTDAMALLVADLEHRKRMEVQFPQGVSGRDMIYAGAKEMLVQCESLNAQYQKAQDKIAELTIQNHDLSQRCESLHLENENLRTQIQQLRKGSATPKKNAQKR